MDRGQQAFWRRGWLWLAGSAFVHVLILGCFPALDTPRQCPLLHVTLEKSRAATVAAPVAPAHEPVKSESAKQSPKQAVRKPRPTRASRVNTPIKAATQTTPIVAETRAPVQQTEIVATPAKEPEKTSANSAPTILEVPDAPRAENEVVVEPAAPKVDVAALKRAYAADALGRVQRSKFYPAAAQSPENEGQVLKVRVSFQVSQSGSLLGVSVKSSSGNAVIDNAALDAVRRAAPFGHFPEGLALDKLTLGATLEYRLVSR